MDQNHPPCQPANPNRTLWIGDLDKITAENVLSDFLKKNSLTQVVSNVSVIKNVPKRYGFVEFTSRDAAEAALKSLNDTQKPCWWSTDKFRVDWAESFIAGEGRNNPEYTPIPTRPTPTLTPTPTPTRPDSVKKSYTIWMKSRPGISEEDATEEHYRILATYLGSSDLAHEAMIQPSGKYFNGFSAFIHDSVAKEIEAHPNVKSVFPTVIYHLPEIPRAKGVLSIFGNSDVTCSPIMTYETQVARAPFAECFGNNSTNGWSKSFSNKGYDSEGKATWDRN